MTSYWLSFRLHDSDGWEASYQKRRDDLYEQIRQSCGDGANWWVSTSSFIIFQSAESIDTIAARVKTAIDTSADLVVIGMNDIKGGRVIGHCSDNDIFALVTDMKKS